MMKILAYLLIVLLLTVGTAQAVQPPESIQTQKGDSLSFVVWGHPRGPTDGSKPLYLDEILGRIAELDPNFIVVTGDVVSGGASRSKPLNPDLITSDWEFFDRSIEEKLGIPVYRTPGNHDVNNFTTRDIYLKRYRKPPYAITVNDSRLIFLDSVGINQRKNDRGRYWDFQGLYFDKPQLEFIKNEIARQDAYHHVFFFWHHTRMWSKTSSPWWKDIHPLLKGGKTRAIITGDPIKKYMYDNHDGIHYICSSILETPPVSWLKNNPGTKAGWDVFRQLDNIQHVIVNADDVEYRTIVVGALQNEGLSPSYWESYYSSLNWKNRMLDTFKKYLVRPRHLLLAISAGAFIWIIIGLLTGYFLFRNR